MSRSRTARLVRPAALAALGVAATLLATLTGTTSASAIIGGAPATTTAAGTVALGFFDNSSCTGTLWKSNIVITAGHCLVDANTGTPAGPFDLQIWPPGADPSTTPQLYPGQYAVHWNPGYQDLNNENDADAGLDHGFLVFDTTIGTPVVSRLATPSEVQALSVTRSPITVTGYGSTIPKDGAPWPPGPMAVTLLPIQPYYDGNGPGVITVLTSTSGGGPCFGDSGGPWTSTILGQTVLVATDVQGDGPACSPNGQPTGSEQGAVTSADPVAQQALADAGQPTEVVATTCIQDADNSSVNGCDPGYAWNYLGCWSSAKGAMLQQRQANGAWTNVGPMQVQQGSTSCGSKSAPVALVASGFLQSGSAQLRVVQGKESPDVFTVTVQPPAS